MNKKAFNYILISGLIAIPIVLLLLPADFFDKGQSICLSVLLLNKTCYGCGMTRAIQHIIHFDFATASSFNKVSFIVFPILVFIYCRELISAYNRIKASRNNG